ncbi:LexA family protein [Flaviaesturariibacter amylovorans]|uniref:Peptidase S24/S26A/S26B/S26C domain-containing protein n=1 Tax=Flaviaesturariibacter amylovorans TaxID=1084520 RepID=A0ABP8GB06_9BACT
MEPNDYFLPSRRNSTDNIEQAPAPSFGAAQHEGIDLNEQLIRNKAATFFMRVHSEAMAGAGIHTGDVVIVDRALEAAHGRIVIAVVNGELLIRRYEKQGGKACLVPASKLAPIPVDGDADKVIWGVVTYVIHHMGA